MAKRRRHRRKSGSPKRRHHARKSTHRRRRHRRNPFGSGYLAALANPRKRRKSSSRKRRGSHRKHRRWGRVRAHSRRVNPETLMHDVLRGALGAALGAVVLVGTKMGVNKFAPQVSDSTGNLLAAGAGVLAGGLVAIKKSPQVGLATVGASLAVPAIAQVGKLFAGLTTPATSTTAVSALFDAGAGKRFIPGGRNVGALFDAQAGRRIISRMNRVDAVLVQNGLRKLV